MDFDNFQKASINALVRLADTREKSTGVHIERTSSLCKLLTKLICEKEIYKDKVDQDYIDNLCLVSPLHDIGKIGIPDAILLKPGKLTEEEFEIMKTHVDIGLTVLVNLREMIPKNGILIFAKGVKNLAWYSTSAAKEYTDVFPAWVARIAADSYSVSSSWFWM